MLYVIPNEYTTVEQKLVYCFRTIETLRRMHNIVGDWFTGAVPITPELFAQLPDYLQGALPIDTTPTEETVRYLQSNIHMQRHNDVTILMLPLLNEWRTTLTLTGDEFVDMDAEILLTNGFINDESIIVDLNTTFIEIV